MCSPGGVKRAASFHFCVATRIITNERDTVVPIGPRSLLVCSPYPPSLLTNQKVNDVRRDQPSKPCLNESYPLHALSLVVPFMDACPRGKTGNCCRCRPHRPSPRTVRRPDAKRCLATDVCRCVPNSVLCPVSHQNPSARTGYPAVIRVCVPLSLFAISCSIPR